MSNLLSFIISPYFIFSSILLSNGAVRIILRNKVEKHTDRLIRIMINLPLIPIFWLWRSIELGSSISSFYGALSFTIIAISMFIYAIIKYRKKQFSGKKTTAK